MNRQEFGILRDAAYKQIASINDVKGHDYAGDEDALANFKEAARQLGVSPYVIWYVYFHKHWSAIQTFLKEGDVASEPIEGRIYDAILYLFLLLGLIQDSVVNPSETIALSNDPQCPAKKGADVVSSRCERFVGHTGPHYADLGSTYQFQWPQESVA